MRTEHESDFRFTLTRSVLLSDLLAFRDFLTSKGHAVALLKRHQGGIDFSPQQCGGKDLRWRGFSGIGVDASRQNFVHNPSTTARKYLVDLPEWHRDNNIGITLKELGIEKFSEDERSDIREGMVSCLGVIDNAIYNRTKKRWRVLQDDESRYVDIFLEYDRKREVRRWTIASPDYPDIDAERLFQCWHCKEDKPDFCFNAEEEAQSFYSVLECFVDSAAPCCSCCAYKLTRCHAPLPRNVSVSQERKQKRKKR